MNISQRLYDITKRRMIEREKLLAEHNKKFAAEFAQLKEDCGKEGHVRGNYHNNGLGWEWYYCAECGGRFDENAYGIEKE